MFYVLQVWMRRRATTAPRIENLKQLETLCESDTDRELWQCLVECIVDDLAIPRIPDLHDDAWRNALHALRWRISLYRDEYPIHKSQDGLLFDQIEDARDSAEYRLADEINCYLSRVFEGKEFMTATKTKKPNVVMESDNELLKRSLSTGDFARLKANGATDDELLVAINQAWRKPLVPGPRKYTISTNKPGRGTAIWFDTISQMGVPSYSTFSELSKREFLQAVRDLLHIDFREAETNEAKTGTNGHENGSNTAQFETIKRKGKSRSIPHPATTSTSTPAGILANDPDAAEDEDRAQLGPIQDFAVLSLRDSPYQTRGEPDDAWLQELADSMAKEGQLQPCLIRPDGELIGGHTRWRAAKRLKWSTLQVRIVTCDDTTARRLVLLDNAKRKDLTDRERCQAYCELLEEYKGRGKTQAQLAEKLGIDETTLSNIVRLRAIPDELWSRYEAKCLSIDHMRKLTVHAQRPKFVAAFLSHLKAIGCDDEVPETHHFESAFDRGIESCFRPMKKDQYRDSGCLFKPNAVERELLEIVEVDRRYEGKVPMAANIELWNKLQKAAKAKLKEKRQAATPVDPKQQKAAAKAEADRLTQRRKREIDDCWHTARALAISHRFEKPKKQDHSAAVRLRMYIAQIEGHWGDWVMEMDQLTTADAEFVTSICADVHEYFKESNNYFECEHEELAVLAEWLQLDPVPFWRPSADLLHICTADELQEIANEFDLPENQTANDLVDVLLKKWPAGLVPNQFCLEQPRAKAKPKKPARAK